MFTFLLIQIICLLLSHYYVLKQIKMEYSKQLEEELNNSFKNGDFDKILPLIQNKDYTAKHLNISSRNLLHWREKGLLFDINKASKTTSKFSISDLFWLRTIQVMRNFGFSIPDIQRVKALIVDNFTLSNVDENKELWFEKLRDELIAKEEPKEKIDEFMNYIEIHGMNGMYKEMGYNLNSLEFILLVSVLHRKEAGILIFNDRERTVMPWYSEMKKYDNSIADMLNETHLYISFSDIFAEFLTTGFKELNGFISDKELTFLEETRKSEVVEGSFTKQNGEITKFNCLHKDDNVIVAKAITKSDFQDITIKIRHGKVIKMSREELNNQ